MDYAKEYSRELAQAFPYVLNFGALYSTDNNNKYRWVNAKTIEIPSISTTDSFPSEENGSNAFLNSRIFWYLSCPI